MFETDKLEKIVDFLILVSAKTYFGAYKLRIFRYEKWERPAKK